MPGTFAHDNSAPSLTGGFATPLIATTTSTAVGNAARVDVARVRLQTGTVTGTTPTLDVEVQACDDPSFVVANFPIVSLGRFSQLNGPLTAATISVTSWTNASPMVFTASAATGFAVGNQVTVSASSGSVINGTYLVNTTPSTTTFTLASSVVGTPLASLGATGTLTITPVTIQTGQTKYLLVDVQKLYVRAVATAAGTSPSYAGLVIDIDPQRYERTGTDSA